MIVHKKDIIHFDFVTHNAVSGAVSDATSATYEVFEEDNDIAIASGSATKRASKTGNYRVGLNVSDAAYDEGKFYNIVVTATVGGVTAKGVAGTFQVNSALRILGAGYWEEQVGGDIDVYVDSTKAVKLGTWVITSSPNTREWQGA